MCQNVKQYDRSRGEGSSLLIVQSVVFVQERVMVPDPGVVKSCLSGTWLVWAPIMGSRVAP